MPRTLLPLTGMRFLLPALLAALIALLVGPLTGDSAAAKQRGQKSAEPVPSRFFGVSGRKLNGSDPARMAAAGVGTYRTLFHPQLAKRSKDGFYYWGELDRIVRRTASNGIDLLPLLYGTPAWISDDQTRPPVGDPEAEAEWRRLLRALVDRYGPGGLYWRLHPFLPERPITAWQIWNEPNDENHWGPTVEPRDYARLLQISAEAIRSVDPGATVVAAGVVAEPFRRGVPGAEYLEQLAAMPVARAAADRFAYHPYGRNARQVRRHMWRARQALNEAGARTEKLWVTEVGWGSDRALDLLLSKRGEMSQARALERTFRSLLRRRGRLGLDRVLWYYWRDHHDPFCVWCRSAGLLRNSYRAKPAYAAFREIAGGREP